ncbi:tRNA 2-selenouridine(34) synthase MnmH [Desulfosediminicola flagellatus]|uniref:tRNA 2-selenouridine(34) synthase MnmH n=1 Tax=Desulfosediminicola flagellatus TaxID=2569541 RepID=UPI0010ACF542|nr:tRNA 2-selenouridine(34) synthase MnmH [Desulfosediminicola flagellatus]
MKKNVAKLSQTAVLKAVPVTLTFEQVLTDEYCIIDVRSPQEFLDGSLPEAINIPIFDNEERKLVGTVYKYGGPEKAVDTGFDLVESRMAKFLEGFEQYRGKNIAIFCARGGMRSRSVVNLLKHHGYTVWQIEGGYKKYRNLLLGVFENFSPKCIVLHGHTGTGKTRILQHLSNMIDLEGIAQHQSSLFGGLNRQPRTQKNFDSHFHQVICRLGAEPYFIEGESRKLGGIYLPPGLASAMKCGHLVLVTASIETRVSRIVEDYPIKDDETVQKVERILKSLRGKLGQAVTDKLCMLFKENKLHELVHILLVEYYDKRYANSMKNYTYHLEVSSEDIPKVAETLTEFRDALLP